MSGFIASDSTAMRRNYHYTSGVIIFTHCYTPFAWRSDLEELAIPTSRQSERRRAPTLPGGTRPGAEGPLLQRRCSEASRPMLDRSTVFAPVRAAADKLERLPDKRVEGMRDANC